MKEIDVSQVPFEKLTDPDFLRCRSQMEAVLKSDQWVTGFSAHEAGHLIYFRRAGWKDFDYRGPTILFDSARCEFKAIVAAVRPAGTMNEAADKVITLEQFIMSMAKGHAAGGVVIRSLTSLPDAGDDGDYEDFSNWCTAICAQHPHLPIDRKRFWEDAQKAVAKDLRKPPARKEIWDVAKEIRPILFGQPTPMTTPIKKILIDVSQVPLLKQEDPEFKSIFAMMERKLADPKEIEAICIHESMHMYYLMKSGVDDFIFTGPTITYDEKEGFDHTGASVQAKSFDKARAGQIPGLDWSFFLGKAAVGGGIAVEKLCPEISDHGDSGDLERFDTIYDIVAKAGLSISKTDFRKESERLVRAELDTIPGLEKNIREIADGFIKDKLFTWI